MKCWTWHEKVLKPEGLTRYESRSINRQSQATAFEAGRFEFQKRSGFLNGERGWQVVVYM